MLKKSNRFNRYIPPRRAVCSFSLTGRPATFFSVGIFTAIAIAMAIAMLYGCALVDTSLTREQRLYAAWIDYTVVATAAAEYCESPTANPEIKARIKILDRWAYEALTEMAKGKGAEDEYGNRLAYVAELVKTMKGLLK